MGHVEHFGGRPRLRPSHRKMDTVLFRWDNLPSPERLAGEANAPAAYPPGESGIVGVTPRRCFAWQTTWPHKVFAGGRIQSMTQSAFAGIAGGEHGCKGLSHYCHSVNAKRKLLHLTPGGYEYQYRGATGKSVHWRPWRARTDADRLDIQELMEQAWRAGAAYCHRCPEVEVRRFSSGITWQRSNVKPSCESMWNVARISRNPPRASESQRQRSSASSGTTVMNASAFAIWHRRMSALGVGYDDDVPESPKAMVATGCQ